MILTVLVFLLSAEVTLASEKGPRVQQIDIRRRLSVSVQIPQTVRLRVRTSVEYRYKPKK